MSFLTRFWRRGTDATPAGAQELPGEPSTGDGGLATANSSRYSAEEKSSLKGDESEVQETEQTSPGQLTLEEGKELTHFGVSLF